jgi:hypothetical protein
LNACGACGEDFNSLKLFDWHRVGVHAYTISEALRMHPPREDGRRCLDTDEMRERGWCRNQRGRWIDPVEVARGVSALHRIADAVSGEAA